MSRQSWEYIKLGVEKPIEKLGLLSLEAGNLERNVAFKIALLLARYGERVFTNIDATPGESRVEPKLFEMIDLLPFELEDGGELRIGQYPFTAKGRIIDAGAHSLVVVDNHGHRNMEITIWDPLVNGGTVRGPHNMEMSGHILEEIYYALCAVWDVVSKTRQPNGTMLQTEIYPRAYIEPELIVLDKSLQN